ncbi:MULTISPECIES: hypothetical protein [Bacillus cereus group]|uniref:hypothetical protein n=1 Tax=Bacillus cereus group TaxID=86661 RepID=UPI0011556ACC|nr:hypothetical protein [Bacillus thuringiensis]MCU5046999.1 hypothetical protein [Bacillus cereus]MCU5648352.1 hypothetical protein [Bacillus cereus]
MDKSIKLGNVNGGTFNLNTGDSANQSISIVPVKDNELFKELLGEINKLKDEEEKQDAIDNAKKLQSAIESGNKSRAEKIFEWLPQVVQTCQAALGIAQQIQSL